MRLLFICWGLLWGYVCGGCSSQQKPNSSPLISSNAPVVAAPILTLDTLSHATADTATYTLNNIGLVDTGLVVMEEKALPPEEKIVLQKATGIYREADWAPAIHYDLRKPNFVILHHTSQNSIAQTVRTFQLEHTKVSAHYIIGKDGQIIQMLNDFERAWHAGRSKWGANTDLNSASIGIELDNNGREPFAEDQIESLLVLLDTLKNRYNIPQLNFIGHADIAPTRKNDPSTFFPWKRLAEHGFGIWYNEDYLLQPPVDFNPIDALKIIGYDMSNPEAAIRAFKQKYIVKDVSTTLTEHDKAVLFDLYRKYY